MPQADIAQESPLPVPGKVDAQIRKRNALIGKVRHRSMADNLKLGLPLAEITASGQVYYRGRVKCRISQWFDEAECSKKRLEVDIAARLKIHLLGLSTPTAASEE